MAKKILNLNVSKDKKKLTQLKKKQDQVDTALSEAISILKTDNFDADAQNKFKKINKRLNKEMKEHKILVDEFINDKK